METLYQDAQKMIERTIAENLPHTAVENALTNHKFTGNIYLVAIGKAAWNMAEATSNFLGNRIQKGIVITKYDHSKGSLPQIEIIEAGHPLSDENTLIGTKKVMELAENLTAEDELLFLISGGGSALFEYPLEGISLDDIIEINNQLLASGADIVEINMIRKRLSSVKAGRFAELCKPASIFTVVLSDVLGDRLDSIASGPASPDTSTVEDAMAVVKKYKLQMSPLMLDYLSKETPKKVENVETVITGSVRTLCDSASAIAKELGYTPHILTSTLNCEAREAGRFLASIAEEVGQSSSSFQRPCAILAGGETIVHLKGSGLGGRNQELAFAAAEGIAGLENVVLFSLGSDGTDGPTDAAGGIVDGTTMAKLAEKGIRFQETLDNNDSYHALKEIDSLIITGPTGTNVNDISVILCK